MSIDDVREHKKRVIGPDGRILTLADLPAPTTVRWIARRKAEIVASVNGGLLSMAEACAHYSLSEDEFLQWSRSWSEFGLSGLHLRSRRRKRHAVPNDPDKSPPTLD